MGKDNSEMGKRVREVRRNKNMTQQELADKVGVSVSFIGHVERGARSVSLVTMMKICDALELTPEVLLGEEKQTETEKKDPVLTNQITKQNFLIEQLLTLAQKIVVRLDQNSPEGLDALLAGDEDENDSESKKAKETIRALLGKE